MEVARESFKDEIGCYNRSALNIPLKQERKDNYMKNTIVRASKVK